MQNTGRLPSIKETDETKILLPQVCFIVLKCIKFWSIITSERYFLLFQYCPTCYQEIKDKHRTLNFPHSHNDHIQEKVESVIDSSLLEQGNVTRSPDVRSHSIPGYFKMPDVDHPKDNELQFVRVPYATALQVPKVLHMLPFYTVRCNSPNNEKLLLSLKT